MAIERTFYCDAPECDGHVRTAGRRTAPGMITAKDRMGGPTATLHFCSWDCVLKYAATVEPVETIPFAETPD